MTVNGWPFSVIGASDDLRIAAEAPPPEAVAQDGHRSLLRRQRPRQR